MKAATNGWNWGYYDLMEKDLLYQVDDKEVFTIPLDMVALASNSSKNEVAVEFNNEAEKTK
jgi:hypothetical protein